MTKTSSSSGQLQGQGLLLSNSSLATCSSDCRNFSEDEQRHRRDVRREREARSLALEKAYVHDVYEQISANFSDSRYRPWPRVKQFLMDLEPGSFVCDVGECKTALQLEWKGIKVGCLSCAKMARCLLINAMKGPECCYHVSD